MNMKNQLLSLNFLEIKNKNKKDEKLKKFKQFNLYTLVYFIMRVTVN
jgi:hypothetical protein